jgi:hypothetical protein
LAATVVSGCTGTIGPDTGGGPSGTGATASSSGGNKTGSGAATGSGGSGASNTSSGGSGASNTSSGGSGAGGNGSGAGSGSSSTGGSSGLDTPACTPGIPATSQIPRLTNAQYDRTVRDLLGVTGLAASGNAAPSSLLATDQSGSLSQLGWSAYQTVAQMIATQVMADPALKANFMKCTPAGDGSSCLHDTIVDFGRRAFRRALTADEVASFTTIVSQAPQITAGGTPDEVAQVLLDAFLVSPSFLQRSEISETGDAQGNYVLSGAEVASRLSYMLWGSMPDAVLDAAADQDQLQSKEQILAQAERMLKDPKARDMVSAFHRSYLLMGTNTRWDSASHDTSLFPGFNKALIPVVAAETERFFDDIVFDHAGSFQDFFTSTAGFVNAQTAPLYGLDPGAYGTDLTPVTLDAAERPGFLTRLGFLSSYSSFNRTSPILRGAFIMKQVLGFDPGAPPPDALNTPLPPQSGSLDTNRKQVDAQTSPAACTGCHQTYINPPGFALEAFNAVGQWQTTEAGTGAPIDTTGDVVIDDKSVHVTAPADLMAALASSVQAQRRYADLWVNFAYARTDNSIDACTVNELAAKITQGGYTVLNLIADLTQTDSFRVRATEVSQ